MNVTRLLSIITCLIGGAAHSETVFLECRMKEMYSNIGRELLSIEGHQWRVIQTPSGYNIRIRYSNGWMTGGHGLIYSLSQPPGFWVFSLQPDEEGGQVKEVYSVFTVHQSSGIASFTTHQLGSSLYSIQRGTKPYAAAVTHGSCSQPE